MEQGNSATALNMKPSQFRQRRPFLRKRQKTEDRRGSTNPIASSRHAMLARFVSAVVCEGSVSNLNASSHLFLIATPLPAAAAAPLSAAAPTAVATTARCYLRARGGRFFWWCSRDQACCWSAPCSCPRVQLCGRQKLACC